MKRSKKLNKAPTFVLVLMLLVAVLTLSPMLAQADAIDNAVLELQGIYSKLQLDTTGKAAVQTAKTNLAAIDKTRTSAPWPGVFSILLTPEVESRFASQNEAKDKIIDFVADLAAVQYSTSSTELKSNLEAFKAAQQSTITTLFGSDFTADDLYNFLVAAEGSADDAVSALSIDTLINIASGNYDTMRPSLVTWMKEALNIAAQSNPAFQAKLSDIGWSVDELVDAKNLVSQVVDPGYAGEVALIKAYVRTQSTSTLGTSISLTVGQSVNCQLTVLGYSLAGSVLEWTTTNPSIAKIENSQIVAVSAGTTQVIAYNSDVTNNWAYKATVTVTAGTTSGGGGGGGGGGLTTPPPTTTPPATTVPTQIEQVNQTVTQQLTQVVQNITNMTTAAALDTVKNTIQTIIQSQATALAETKTTVAQAAAAVVQKVATIAQTAVTSKVEGTTTAVSVDAAAITQKIAEVAGVVSDLAAKMTEAKMQDVVATIEKKVVIEAPPSVQETKEVAVNVPSAAVSQLKEAGVALEVKTPEVTFSIPAASIPSVSQSAVMQVLAAKLSLEEAREALSQAPSAIGGPANVAGVMDLSIKSEDPSGSPGGQQSAFKEKVRVAIKYDPQKVKDPELLGVYRFNEQAKKWDFKGGRADVTNGVVNFKTDHFSLYALMEYTKTFADIQGHWAKRPVEVLAGKHIIKGMTDETFDPDQKVTRAQFAALIANTLELDTDPNAAARFSDVAADAWYRGVIGAVAKAGIIRGYDSFTFGPNDLITREQAAVMLANALKYNQSPVAIDDSKVSAQLSVFTDNTQISPWAQKGVALLTKESILAGYNGNFAPGGQATRAEAAAMLYKVLKKL